MYRFILYNTGICKVPLNNPTRGSAGYFCKALHLFLEPVTCSIWNISFRNPGRASDSMISLGWLYCIHSDILFFNQIEPNYI